MHNPNITVFFACPIGRNYFPYYTSCFELSIVHQKKDRRTFQCIKYSPKWDADSQAFAFSVLTSKSDSLVDGSSAHLPGNQSWRHSGNRMCQLLLEINAHFKLCGLNLFFLKQFLFTQYIMVIR